MPPVVERNAGLPDGWPVPDAAALSTSRALTDRVCREIDGADGWISFARYMELALYAPGLGYYSAGARKFGPGGDFITAPEVSGLFSRCVASCCASVLHDLRRPLILELGAGSGVMAADMLAELERGDRLPERYLILERSADLRERQRQLLAERVPALLPRVEWLDGLPRDAFEGVILGNEVLDALPVERFRVRDGHPESLGVACDGGGLRWAARDTGGTGLAEYLAVLPGHVAGAPHYVSEINPGLPAWLDALADRLRRGMMLWIDYGYPRAEYYHAQRSEGTLRCYYRHRAHDDPFLLPGLQDITAHVDFTGLAEAAEAAGLDVLGFNTQAAFLLDAGLERLLADAMTDTLRDNLRLASEVKTLTLPGEMGERFKCMSLGRGVDRLPAGFRAQDLRGRL